MDKNDFAHFINSLYLLLAASLRMMVKPGKPLIGIGIIVSVFGIMFFLQGKSLVGPKYSFMYSNPQWVTNGLWIAAMGMIILIAGLLISRLNLQFPKS